LATVVSAMREHRHQLDTSVGVSGPRDLTVRIVLFVGARKPTLQQRHAHRIPHPTFVTIAKRPS
jgi:hypothetical protein